MSKFNYGDHNIDLTCRGGRSIVVLYKQNGESMEFASFDLFDDAAYLRHDLLEVMETRSRSFACNEPVDEPDMRTWENNPGESEIYLYIPADDCSVEGDSLYHLEHAVPMMNWLVEWCEEWEIVNTGPSIEQASQVIGDLVGILAQVGPHLTCSEAETVAGIARLYLTASVADAFLFAHAQGDSVGEGDAHCELATKS